MSNPVITPNMDAIITEIDVAAPPERVFRVLTDSGELMQWFTDSSCPVRFWKMDARVGGKYSYATEKGSIVINGVSEFECHGEILELDPPRLLAYTWIANWHMDKKRKTVVRRELAPRGGRTHVKVTHSGLGQEDLARKDYTGGWPGVLDLLRKHVER